MNETKKQVTDIQHNADEMVAAGFKKNLAMKVANIIERSIAVPIDDVKAEINGVKVEIEKLKNSLKWTLTHVVIPVLILFIGAGGYMSKQIYNLNADVGEIKGTIAQLDKRVDVQFEQVKDRFEQVDAQFEQVDVRFDRMDDRIDKVVEKVTELRVDFVRMDERITGMDERMDERMTRMEGTLKQMFEFMKEKARVSSSVPEAVPGETDISFDPDQD